MCLRPLVAPSPTRPALQAAGRDPSVLSLPARWKSHQPAGAGLVNTGNSCYINSTLQVCHGACTPPLATAAAPGEQHSFPRTAALNAVAHQEFDPLRTECFPN